MPEVRSFGFGANSIERAGEIIMNTNKRAVEVFSAGCPACEPTVQLIKSIACPSCDVQVLDMNKPDVATKAKQYGVKTVPAVVIDGQLASCCAGAGPNEQVLRAAGIGVSR